MRCSKCGTIMLHCVTDTKGVVYRRCPCCGYVCDEDYKPANGKRVAYVVEGKVEVTALPGYTGIPHLD